MSNCKSLIDFMKNAPEKEKKALFLKAGKLANKDQRKIMNNYIRTKGTPIKQGKTTCSDPIPVINKDKISTKGLIKKLERAMKTDDKIKDIERITKFLEIPSVDWVRLQLDILEYINKREKTARKAGFDDATTIWGNKNMEKGLVLSKMISVALEKQREEIESKIKQYEENLTLTEINNVFIVIREVLKIIK